MRKIKRIFIYIIGFVILSLSNVSVQAASGITAILENEKIESKSGDEVVVTLRLDNYEEIKKGVNVYKATLDYDKNVFEEVSQSNFQTQNNWEELKFNKDTGEFIAIKRIGSKAQEEIVKIKLKVKDNAHAGKGDILIKDIVISEGKEDKILEESKSTIDIIQDQSNQSSNSVNNNSSNNEDVSLNSDNSKDEYIPPIGSITQSGDPGNNNSSNNENVLLNSDNSKDEYIPPIEDMTQLGDLGNNDSYNNSDSLVNSDNSKEEKLPIKGDMSNWMLLFAFVLVGSVIVIVYINNDKFKKYKNKNMIIFLIFGILSLQVVTVAASSFSSKGELNGDGQIDYKDINLLQLYLINQDELIESFIKNADMNNDGSITVTDLSILVQKVEKTLDYQVVLSDMYQYNYYPQKNEEVNLIFLGDVSYNASIEKVVINGKEYNVKKSEDSNIYSVNIGKHDKSGIKEYHFTEVILNNGKRIYVDYTMKLDVLKSAPSIENYTVNENIDESKIDISFDLKDEDKSIKSAHVEILNDNNELIKNNEISSGKNEIDVSVEDGKMYRVNFVINYDLDTNKLTEYEEDHTGILKETKELEFVIDYQLKISDVATYKDDKQTIIFDRLSIQVQHFIFMLH